jgi:tRNA dimethylallyltransferase
LFHGPPADLELRERLLQRETEEPGSPYADLVKLDPEAAIKIHPNDLRRTIRALEVYYLRDKKLSEFQREHAFNDMPYQFKLLFLTRSRSELYPRIERRVDRMIADGLEAEVKTLLDRGYGPELISMKGLGYQHFIAVLLGHLSRDEAIERMKRDTKRFAKRQFTWFRRESEALWLDITGLSTAEEIVERIKKNVEISNNLV